jgi:hypothetical protein
VELALNFTFFMEWVFWSWTCFAGWFGSRVVKGGVEQSQTGPNSICVFSSRRRSHRQRGAYGDFVHLEDLPTQSLKMLIGVGLRTYVHRDECVCVVSVSIALFNSQI